MTKTNLTITETTIHKEADMAYVTTTTTPAAMQTAAKLPKMSRRMSRHEFNGYLYKLYGCTGQNNVKPDYVWGGDEGDYDYHIEVFLNSPAGGTMVALHFGPRMDWVDIAVYAEEVAQ